MKALIIEEKGAFGEKLQRALVKAGYETMLVKNSLEGMRAIFDSLPDLIIMDTALAGVDCYELLEKKQAEPLLAKIPVFLVSAESVPVNMRKIPHGCVAEFFVSANIDMDEIVAKANRRFGKAAPAASLAGPAPSKMTKNKLLWVEDDKLIGTILSKKLTSSGFDLFHAKNGEEAMEILKSVIPDCIVLDLVLPNMSGFDILQEIKKDPALSKIPVMILSNLSKQSDIERAQMLGAQKFLVKASASLDEIAQEVRLLCK